MWFYSNYQVQRYGFLIPVLGEDACHEEREHEVAELEALLGKTGAGYVDDFSGAGGDLELI
jgi:hypothetical protein